MFQYAGLMSLVVVFNIGTAINVIQLINNIDFNIESSLKNQMNVYNYYENSNINNMQRSV